ncbi:MAG: hypothetical protein ACRCZD_12720 [Phycicoccus sp.]
MTAPKSKTMTAKAGEMLTVPEPCIVLAPDLTARTVIGGRYVAEVDGDYVILPADADV